MTFPRENHVTHRIVLALIVALAASAAAEDPKARAAREELERQLSQMVGKQPTRVRIDFVGLDDPNYRIEEASFDLDGRTVSGPSLSQLSEDGTHLVWNGDVTPGKHTVKVLLVFSNGASIVLSDEGGYKWKVGGDVSFEVNSGIEVRVQVTPKRDGKQTDVAKRFKLSLPAQPVMIAQLDDGKMPEVAPKPVIAVVDAGVPGPTPEQLAAVAAEEKKQQTLAAAEAKKQKAAEALEAKRLAVEAKKQQAADALEARRLAAAEKKERAAAAREAKRAAEEEKKRAVQQLAEEKKRLAQAALEPTSPADAGLAAVVAVAEPPPDAGVEIVDAGAPVAVVIAVVDAGAPVPVAGAPAGEEEEGPPWLLIGLSGGVAALIFLVVVARRRARPPTLDD